MEIYVVWKSRGGMCWERCSDPNAAKQTIDDVLKREQDGERGTELFWILTGPALTPSDLHELCSDKESK